MNNKVKKILSSTLAVTLATATMFTTGIVVNAAELPNVEKTTNAEGNVVVTQTENPTEYNTVAEKVEEALPEVSAEPVLNVNSVEEIDSKDTINETSDSVFKSCRLIITNPTDLEFKEESLGVDNIVSVQKYEDKYFVTYRSVYATEKAYNDLTALGLDVEIDVVQDTPEGVEIKDDRGNDIEAKNIALTEEARPTKSVEDVVIEDTQKNEKTIVVAVLDTGLNNDEAIFDDKVIEGKNFVSEQSGVKDLDTHGTTMSRIVLDTTEGNVKILPIKVLNDEGKGTTLSAYKGIKYVIEKKKENPSLDFVINLSMSGIGHSKLLESAINEAYNNNIPVVVSAGNDNKEITEYTPANIASAFTITSSDKNEDKITKAVYSNYGSDNVKADYTTSGHYEYVREIQDEKVVTKVDGTSVSSAYVSSYITLLKQMALTDEDENNNDLTISDVDKSLTESAIKLDDANSFGRGYLDKENILPKKVEAVEEVQPLPVEDVSGIEENIELIPNYTTSGPICIDNVVIFAPGPEAVYSGMVAKLKSSCGIQGNIPIGYDRDVNALFKEYCKDNAFHIISADWIFLTDSNSLEINGTKEIRGKDADGKDNQCISSQRELPWSKGAIIHVNSGCKANIHDLVIGAKDSNDWGSNGITFPTGKYNTSESRPTITNNGTLTISNCSIRTTLNKDSRAINNTGNLTIAGDTNIVGGTVKLFNGNGATTTFTGSSNSLGYCDKNYVTDKCIWNQKGTINCNTRVAIGDWADRFGGMNSPNTAVYNDGGTFNYNSSGTIGGRNYCINNNYGTVNTAKGCDIGTNIYGHYNINDGKYKYTGIYSNGGTLNINGTVKVTNIGIDARNSAKCNIMTNADIKNNNTGIQNYATVTQSGGAIQNNSSKGVSNSGTYTMSGGSISSNADFGIDNSGTVTQTGGAIYSNKGSTPEGANGGVLQNGTYNVGAGAEIRPSNSVYLKSGRVINVISNLSTANPIPLTTDTNDRTVGRVLVTANSTALADANESKFRLAFEQPEKDDDNSNFSGLYGAVRAGSRTDQNGDKNLDSGNNVMYLSGLYTVDYNGLIDDVNNLTSINPKRQYTYWKELKDTNGVKNEKGRGELSKVYNTNGNFDESSWTYLGMGTDEQGRQGTGENVFIGWTTEANWRNLNVGEYPLYTTEEMEALNKNKTFYAVYRRSVGTITYHANGAVDDKGKEFADVSDDKQYKIFNDSFANDGSMFGKKQAKDDTILGATKQMNNTTSYTYFEVKKGEVINSLGNKDNIASFQGWSAINYAGNSNADILYNKVSPFLNIWTNANAVLDLNYTKKPVGLSMNKVEQNIVDRSDVYKTTPNMQWNSIMEKTGVVNAYAIWDLYPVIKTDKIRISSKDDITDELILKQLEITDEEDGKLKGDSVRLEYDKDQLKAMVDEHTCYSSITVYATDSAGNTTRKVVVVAMNQTNPLTREQQGFVRLISREYYNKSTEAEGGCVKDSVWYKNQDYVNCINSAFDNLENDNAYDQDWYFTHKQVVDVQKYIKDNGFGKTKSNDSLKNFHNKYAGEGCLKGDNMKEV